MTRSINETYRPDKFCRRTAMRAGDIGGKAIGMGAFGAFVNSRVGIAKLNSYSTSQLLAVSWRPNTSQGTYQCRFSMVNVTNCSNVAFRLTRQACNFYFANGSSFCFSAWQYALPILSSLLLNNSLYNSNFHLYAIIESSCVIKSLGLANLEVGLGT